MKGQADVMELSILSWNAFVETGDIDAYLLYKSISNNKEGTEELTWEPSQKQVLL